MDDLRPDPDALLSEIKREEEQAKRGKLKIFFGSCAGVGKTYAMLNAARAKKQEGIRVIVGVVETHGRKETEAQLQELELLPAKSIAYKGRQLSEFDIDGALALQPDLILIDEFAHSNSPGSRHPKRWQDVEELLAAGIDVYTTLNVQHLESLNDIVGQITGIIVRETLPDKVFDLADEVALIDLPPDELLTRLAAGKVYIPHQAERAGKNFFRKGNLLALRELALRRTADRVDAQMRAYRADQSISPIWQARERLLLCLEANSPAEKLVRSTKRLASSLDADWIVVYVETPEHQRLAEEQHHSLLKAIRLSQELGAETTILAGTNLATTLLAYARSRNVSKLVVGQQLALPLWQRWKPSLLQQLNHAAADIDIHVVAHEPENTGTPQRNVFSLLFGDNTRTYRRHGYLAAVGSCALMTLISSQLTPLLELTNIIMVYLLAVVLVSIRFGRGAGILASFLSVAAFDFFFVPPRFSFSVSDTQYLLTFIIMLVVALIISQLTSKLQFEANIATYRERRTRALYDLGRELAGALTASQIIETGIERLEPLFNAQIMLFIPNSAEECRPAMDNNTIGDNGIAQWVYDNQQPAGLGTNTLPSNPALYVPLKAPMRVRGVMALLPREHNKVLLPEQQRLLETCATQIALALERVHYVEVAQDAIVAMESERLRNSVLSVVSHDLRTPLTTLVGLSSLLSKQLQTPHQHDLAESIHHEALRMNNLVTNLLDMAKLQSGVKLNKEWQLLDEVVGSAARACEQSLKQHQFTVQLPAALPALEYDAVLIERVLVNLLENAAKYTPADSHIGLGAHQDDQHVYISVRDNGPGLPAGMENKLFDKFTRGMAESSTPGIGLGLAICRTIIENHGGTIQARNVSPHGAEFMFSLPLGQPPSLPAEEMEML